MIKYYCDKCGKEMENYCVEYEIEYEVIMVKEELVYKAKEANQKEFICFECDKKQKRDFNNE